MPAMEYCPPRLDLTAAVGYLTFRTDPGVDYATIHQQSSAGSSACMFPFTHKGVTYNECIKHRVTDSSGGNYETGGNVLFETDIPDRAHAWCKSYGGKPVQCTETCKLGEDSSLCNPYMAMPFLSSQVADYEARDYDVEKQGALSGCDLEWTFTNQRVCKKRIVGGKTDIDSCIPSTDQTEDPWLGFNQNRCFERKCVANADGTDTCPPGMFCSAGQCQFCSSCQTAGTPDCADHTPETETRNADGTVKIVGSGAVDGCNAGETQAACRTRKRNDCQTQVCNRCMLPDLEANGFQLKSLTALDVQAQDSFGLETCSAKCVAMTACAKDADCTAGQICRTDNTGGKACAYEDSLKYWLDPKIDGTATYSITVYHPDSYLRLLHLPCRQSDPSCCEFGIRILDVEDPALQYPPYGAEQYLSRCKDVKVCKKVRCRACSPCDTPVHCLTFSV
jgi:hypothetical protein